MKVKIRAKMRVNISFRFAFDHAPELICYSDLPQVVGVPLCKEGILSKGNDVRLIVFAGCGCGGEVDNLPHPFRRPEGVINPHQLREFHTGMCFLLHLKTGREER